MKEIGGMKKFHSQEINKFQIEKQMDFEWMEKNYRLIIDSMKQKIATEIENVLDFFLNKIEIYINTRVEEFNSRLDGFIGQITWLSKRLTANRQTTQKCFLKLTQKFVENGLSGLVPKNPRIEDIFGVKFLSFIVNRL
jgi:hypothetical protein